MSEHEKAMRLWRILDPLAYALESEQPSLSRHFRQADYWKRATLTEQLALVPRVLCAGFEIPRRISLFEIATMQLVRTHRKKGVHQRFCFIRSRHQGARNGEPQRIKLCQNADEITIQVVAFRLGGIAQGVHLPWLVGDIFVDDKRLRPPWK